MIVICDDVGLGKTLVLPPPRKRVALVGCRAQRWPGGASCVVTGLFDLVEFQPREPAAYVQSACWVIAPVGDDSEGALLTVDADDMWQQVDPAGYGRDLAEQRAQELAEEDLRAAEEA